MNDRRIEWLESVAHVADVEVEYASINSLDGYYQHAERRITINSRLSTVQRVGVLAHELIHALHAHDGPQSPSIEARVDKLVARLLVSPQGVRGGGAPVRAPRRRDSERTRPTSLGGASMAEPGARVCTRF